MGAVTYPLHRWLVTAAKWTGISPAEVFELKPQQTFIPFMVFNAKTNIYGLDLSEIQHLKNCRDRLRNTQAAADINKSVIWWNVINVNISVSSVCFMQKHQGVKLCRIYLYDHLCAWTPSKNTKSESEASSDLVQRFHPRASNIVSLLDVPARETCAPVVLCHLCLYSAASSMSASRG